MSYDLLEKQLNALLDTRDWLTNAAQLVAFIHSEIADLNWVGIYRQSRRETLTLGPFQGLPACNPIPFSRGVCGAAARSRRTQRVDDVTAFPGHIACDVASRSELVIPIEIPRGRRAEDADDPVLWGVLDIDSPLAARFTSRDQAGLEALAGVFCRASDFDEQPRRQDLA